MIHQDKKYKTRCGYPVRITSTDAKLGNYVVIGLVQVPGKPHEEILMWTADGKYELGCTHSMDLVEDVDYLNLPLNTPVWYTAFPGPDDWIRGHFAGMHKESRMPMVFTAHRSEWTAEGEKFTVFKIKLP